MQLKAYRRFLLLEPRVGYLTVFCGETKEIKGK